MPLLTLEAINRIIKDQSKQTIKLSVQNLIDIYKDNWDYIIWTELRHQFTFKTYKKLLWLVTKELNLLKRFVNEISMVYKQPAERVAILGEKETDGEKEVLTDENYEQVMDDSNIDRAMQEVNKYTNLTNHVMVRPVFRAGKIEYDIYLFNNVEIYYDPNDWTSIIAVKYYIGLELPEYVSGAENLTSDDKFKANPNMRSSLRDELQTPIKDFQKAYLFTLEDRVETKNDDGVTTEITYRKGMIYTYDNVNGNEVLTETIENPYRDENGNPVLPFVLFNKTYPVDGLLDFSTGNDLRDANINLAINLIHLNQLIKYQSYKQVYMKVAKKSNLPADLTLDPASIITLIASGENVEDIGVLDMQAAINNLWAVMRERITTVLAQQGISPQNFELSGQPQSGFALKISNMGKMEQREEQIVEYREKEKKLFDITRIVWNYHRPDMPIPMDAEFHIDFAEPEYPLSPEERQKRFNFLKQNNVTTDIDLLMEENPDLDRDEAEQLYQKNKLFNTQNRNMIEFNPIVQGGRNGQESQRRMGGSPRPQPEEGEQNRQAERFGNRQA